MKSRKGVALLITLAVVASMIALIGIAFGYLDSARAKASYKSALIESNYIFSRFAKTLKSGLGKKPTTDTLNMFYSSPLSFSTQNQEFDIVFFCEASSNKIPFAWLAKKGDVKYQKQYEVAQRVFDELVSSANVRNPQKLESMIVSVLEGQSIRYGIKSFAIQKKDIISKNILLDILSDYRFLEDDDSVFKIEWDKYFSYEEASGKNRGKIDAEFASPKLLSIIFDMDKSYVEDTFKAGELNKFMQEAGIDRSEYKQILADKAVADMVCEARFGYADNIYMLKFDYRSGNIKGFEFAEAK